MNKKYLTSFLIFVFSLCIITSYIYAQEEKGELNWYFVEFALGNDIVGCIGTSPMSKNEITYRIDESKAIALGNVLSANFDELESYKDKFPFFKGEVIINPEYIIKIWPLEGDPRKK